MNSGGERSVDSLRNSFKTIMITATEDTTLRLMLAIPNIYRRYTVILRSCPKKQRLTNARNLSVIYMTRKTVPYTKKP